MAMVGLYRNVARAGCLAAVVLIMTPITAAATVTGGCTVTGVASSSGTTDLTTHDTWHLTTADSVTGDAKYPTQTYVHVFAYIFGLPIPVYSSSGKDTNGSAGPFKVSDYSRYTRVFAAGGASDTCTGAVLIIVDDQSAFTNAVGLGGIALTAIGLLGLVALMFMGKGASGCGGIFLGALLGAALGVGAALLAAETGLVDPRNIAGLVVAGVGLIVGISVPILRGRMA
jgi:hypothetical protein